MSSQIEICLTATNLFELFSFVFSLSFSLMLTGVLPFTSGSGDSFSRPGEGHLKYPFIRPLFFAKIKIRRWPRFAFSRGGSFFPHSFKSSGREIYCISSFFIMFFFRNFQFDIEIYVNTLFCLFDFSFGHTSLLTKTCIILSIFYFRVFLLPLPNYWSSRTRIYR